MDWWIKTDPRGYIKSTTELNTNNSDFRKAVKFIKKWKHNHKVQDEEFKLKSFHIEQILFNIFNEDTNHDIFDGIFNFFCDLPKNIESPQIKDRADDTKYIDEYVLSLTNEQKKNIIAARDAFLIKLEEVSSTLDVPKLLKPDIRIRKGETEQYLFDFRIPVFTDSDIKMSIVGEVLPRDGGFPSTILDAIGLINVDREIKFRVNEYPSVYDVIKWKVKNDDNSDEPRGEITDNGTLNNPEHTKFNGDHYVECYAIKNSIWKVPQILRTFSKLDPSLTF